MTSILIFYMQYVGSACLLNSPWGPEDSVEALLLWYVMGVIQVVVVVGHAIGPFGDAATDPSFEVGGEGGGFLE